ncbi:MAG: CbiX/SirB N-terminal domain-containing protein [Acidovorax sp.]
MKRGIVLFAHGSRDPLWRAPIEAVRDQVAALGLPARCAYLELCAPSLHEAVADLAALGIGHVTIVPMFLGTGRHAREDLPRLVAELRALHPHLSITVQPAIGEDPRVTALMAHIAVENKNSL